VTVDEQSAALDRQQRITPVLVGDGSEVAWLADDGQVVSFPAVDATVHVTDRRVVVVAGCGGAAAPVVAQLDHLSLAGIRYVKAADPGGRGTVEIAALTGEPPRPEVTIVVSLIEDDVEAVAHGIYARARSAQVREDVRPLTPAALRVLEDVRFVRDGDEYLADFTGSGISLSDLAARTRSRR
jgi:hypothetical protein